MKVFKLFILVCSVVLIACEGREGPVGLESLVDIVDEPPGTNCTNGGVMITSGIDTNENGLLDPTEVKTTKFVCDGMGPKEVRIDFPSSGSTSSGTPGTNTDSTHPNTTKLYEDLDVSLYPGYDSIVYVVRNVALFNIAGGASPGPETTLVIELVDMTTGTAIANSKITASTGPKFVSANLFGKFPNGKFDVGVRMTSSDANYSGGAYPISLVFIDKN
ncbi:MAG TPA: hypothetical protein VFE50_02410 [Cyclobacteriaceae bacterium]|nr:hypothetical protein [Cyclobacteriaceae bacterium]